MKKKLEQIIASLPEGLSQTGIDDICSLVDEVVEERVLQETKLLEAKTVSFIKSNIEDLKEVARQEVMAELKEAKELDVLNQIKDLISTVSNNDEVERVTLKLEKKYAALEEKFKGAEELLTQVVTEKEELTEALSEASELLEELESEKTNLQESMSIRLSDSALLITRDNGLAEDTSKEEDAVKNGFLTEEVIQLSLTE